MDQVPYVLILIMNYSEKDLSVIRSKIKNGFKGYQTHNRNFHRLCTEFFVPPVHTFAPCGILQSKYNNQTSHLCYQIVKLCTCKIKLSYELKQLKENYFEEDISFFFFDVFYMGPLYASFGRGLYVIQQAFIIIFCI